jgi:hypothetical protein
MPEGLLPPVSFNYSVSVTGNCSNSQLGAATVSVTGGTSPYTVDWYQPNLGVDVVTTVPSSRSGLYSGTYSVRINDSTVPTNNDFYINVPISSGVCCNILGIQNTTCSQNNGYVTGSSTSQYSSTNFYLYHSDNVFSQSAITNQATVIFGSLTAGTYYMVAEDLGGCTGRSETFIIEESQPMSYGLYSVPNSNCGGYNNIGKIYVTGLTGNGPFTYLWSNGATTSSITGLTAGVYSVQVTDVYGCNLSNSATVNNVNPIGFGSFTTTPPTCFSSDGSLTLTITGGTAPYYYSASTGDVLISYSQKYTISGLSSGDYSIQVTDAGLCSIVVGTSIVSPQGISSVSVSAQNSSCSTTNGQITVNVVGGVTPYSYTLIYPDGNSLNVSNNQTTQLFANLVSGTYTVAVSDSSGCNYMVEKTIYTENLFTISTDVTGTTCNQRNGRIIVTRTTGGTEPFDFSLDGVNNIIDTNLTAVTFSNVASGQHIITVNDATGCIQTANVYVESSPQLDYSLYSTSCGGGTSGTITAFITSGTPPFTYQWSDNVSGNPQQIQVSALTAGTYSVVITDSTGCTLKRTTSINCATSYVSYESYTMGSELFQIQSPTKYGLLQMMNEGFADLTSGNTNCDLITAVYTAQVLVNPLGTSISVPFFTATTLNVGPSDNLWYDTVKSILLGINGVSGVIIDSLNNQITIQTSTSNFSLNGQEIIIKLNIVYDIMCLK